MEELSLKDIHLPDPITFWSNPSLFWTLFALALAFSFLLLFLLRKFFKKNVKSEARRVIKKIEFEYQENEDASLCVKELSSLLRRIAISQDESKSLAGLTGECWLKFLDSKLIKPEFSEGPGRCLISGPYQSSVDEKSAKKALELCRKFVEAL